MPPVTRSAARAAEQSTSKTNTRKTSTTKANSAQLSTLSATREAEESETLLNYVAPRHRLLEWLSLKGIAGVALDNGRLLSLLQELYLQKGCQVVARGRPCELIGIL
ncbi:hypothetical protein K7432_000593 [Basidiobolus ranarum]|uniref:Uncharacterized protein n=1 Tax=Basidiobolus ranarum TaxID=34480 RepID=A0ABR2X4F2_9FUNG